MLKIKINPDKDEVTRIRLALKENFGYCPCSVNKTADTVCMCTEFKQQNVPGPCHCGLYYKDDEEE